MDGKNLSTEATGIIAVNLLSYYVSMSNNIFRPNSSSDVGVDGEIEFFNGGHSTKKSLGIICGVQVKGSYSENFVKEDENIRSNIAKDTIDYWTLQTRPIIIVKVLFNKLNNYVIKYMTSKQLQLLLKGATIKFPWNKAKIFNIEEIIEYCKTFNVPKQYAEFRNWSSLIENNLWKKTVKSIANKIEKSESPNWSLIFEAIEPLISSVKLSDTVNEFPPLHHREYFRKKLRIKGFFNLNLNDIQSYIDSKGMVDDQARKLIIRSISFFFCVIESDPINKIREDILSFRGSQSPIKQTIESAYETIQPIIDEFINSFKVKKEDIMDIIEYIHLFSNVDEVEPTETNIQIVQNSFDKIQSKLNERKVYNWDAMLYDSDEEGKV